MRRRLTAERQALASLGGAYPKSVHGKEKSPAQKIARRTLQARVRFSAEALLLLEDEQDEQDYSEDEAEGDGAEHADGK